MAGLPPEPQVEIPPTKIFDNFYYFGFNTVGGWALTTSAGIVLIDTLNSTDDALGPVHGSGNFRDGKRRGVRCKNRFVGANFSEMRKNLFLELNLFDGGLDNEVDIMERDFRRRWSDAV
jgi:hypothetical protein